MLRFNGARSSVTVESLAETISASPELNEECRSSPRSTVLPPPAPPDPYLGTTIDGRYRIESVLGEGGMGVVYLAWHKAIEKRIAVKVLRLDKGRDRSVTDRFLQEAKAASSIGNPHIVDVSDFGSLPDGSAFFTMEWLEGKPLNRVLEEVRPLPVERVVRIGAQIADALAAAHERGIVHRDLKPDNIFLLRRGSNEDFVKILDFGVAKVTNGASKLTIAGTMLGTPLYMSPEQAEGTAVDSRTDIYALGVILYEMAAGRVPFDGDTLVGILSQHMCAPVVPIRDLSPELSIPPELDKIILRALAKKPEERYQTMADIAGDLRRVGLALGSEGSDDGTNSADAIILTTRDVAPNGGLGRRRAGWRMPARVGIVMASVALSLAVVGTLALRGCLTRREEAASSIAVLASQHPAVAPPQVTDVWTDPRTDEPHRVLLVIDPSDAQVLRDGTELGSPPVAVDVPAGATTTLEVRREGFATQWVTLDGFAPTRKIHLTMLVPTAPAKKSRPSIRDSAPTRAAPPTPVGSGEIVNPWAQ
jgi:serine/threonine-protein kinase